MTSAVALQHSTALPSTLRGSRRAQPRGFDRIVIRVSVAMLRWARKRADRSIVPYEEAVLRNRNALDRDAREKACPLGPIRLV
ncbi:hypothetical protein F1C58_09820 [Glaciihabitans sp. INWT7]|uniref:hypothetical protein n=1 Tax=Glaciihabitans sp. INWT7 TaxID=2596912 RepID=UPI00162397C7|nr:hypothetical protein [Glaciihabitans sp. INWT7]QNE47166.1 hypothetical protein F1C58_09820 [Glaciihabitans sp. INWT7]